MWTGNILQTYKVYREERVLFEFEIRKLTAEQNWKCENGKCGTVKNAGVENAGPENAGPKCTGGKCGTIKYGKLTIKCANGILMLCQSDISFSALSTVITNRSQPMCLNIMYDVCSCASGCRAPTSVSRRWWICWSIAVRRNDTVAWVASSTVSRSVPTPWRPWKLDRCQQPEATVVPEDSGIQPALFLHYCTRPTNRSSSIVSLQLGRNETSIPTPSRRCRRPTQLVWQQSTLASCKTK